MLSSLPAAARRKDAAGVQALVLGRPVTAQIRFGRPAICPHASVETAANTVLIQVPTGRNHLSLDREVAWTLYLAEIRRAARTHQCFKPLLPPSAHDFDLQVATARRTTRVVGGP